VPVLLGVATFEEGGSQGVAFVLDLTERKRAEAEAREGERRYREVQMELAHANRVATIGQLTASVAHDISQPITGVITSGNAAVRWLSHEPPELEAARRAIERVLRDAKHAADVIGRVREHIRKAPPQSARFDINEAIREVIDLTHGEAARERVSVQMQLAAGLPSVEGDRVQLQQVTLNLVVNAIEAMSGDCGTRELLVQTREAEASEVLVTVQDTGPGLDPTKPERVFEAFYTSKSNGLGLGLSICRSIVEGHGGRLWASANAPRGAVFHFTVPAQSRADTG
jgi:C4-dicarboxylate-specific signal transduction histidine kinase